MSVITVENLTKDYGYSRGVFDVSFKVEKGEVFGFLGPNGAGKTTTIRHIMGFSKPQKGETSVNDLNSWIHYQDIQKNLGYLPGEIALPPELTGTEFIKMMADLRGITDMSRTQYLLKKFELDPSGSLKRMSLGMKRKLAIVTAFMHNPEILLLDEPTSGLDPVMQHVFIEFIKEEKAAGKTILLSSHIFKEVESTCDRIAIIKEGKIVSLACIDEIKIQKQKTYKIEFINSIEFEKFCTEKFNFILKNKDKKQVHINVHDELINELIKTISNYKIKYFVEKKYTLEDYFMHFYYKDDKENMK